MAPQLLDAEAGLEPSGSLAWDSAAPHRPSEERLQVCCLLYGGKIQFNKLHYTSPFM